MQTDLKIKTTNTSTGAKITTTVGYVNEEANSATLKNFAQKLNAFTTNTYAETDRVQTINVDTEQVPTPAPAPVTLTLNKTAYTLSGSQLIIPFSDFTYTGTSSMATMFASIRNTGSTEAIGVNISTNTAFVNNISTGTYYLSVCIPGTTTYDNAYTRATITIS